MSIGTRLAHESLKAYINRTAGAEEMRLIRQLREDDAGYRLLFELIDEYHDRQAPRANATGMPLVSFAALEPLLERLLAGNPEPEDPTLLLHGLTTSQQFYRRLLIQLERADPHLSPEFAEAVANVRVRPAEDFLSHILEAQTPTQPSLDSAPPPRPRWLEALDRLRKPAFGVPRYAIAGALIVLVAVTVGGLRYYNTAYRISAARNLLITHYSIYHGDEPRLAGGYPSSAIQSLMGEADSTAPYLAEASSELNAAIAHGAKNPAARRLQAQILVIQKKYSQADSLLARLQTSADDDARVFNDRGVTKFKLGRYGEAGRLFEQAIRRDARFAEAYYNLALAQAEQGQFAPAIESMREMLKHESSPEWLEIAAAHIAAWKARLTP